MTVPLPVLLLLLLLLTHSASVADAHIEDYCMNATAPARVKNQFQRAIRSGCEYQDGTVRCKLLSVLEGGSTFASTSPCRGVVHFDAVYVLAAGLGFTGDAAYSVAAFSQAIDFVQYVGYDRCGDLLPGNSSSTPPMRGLLRTNVAAGGTNRHLGVPFVGWFSPERWGSDSPLFPGPLGRDGYGLPMTTSKKTYFPSPGECRPGRYEQDFAYYERLCPGLRPNASDELYEGALAGGRRWAFGETDLLCNGGFTEPTASGSVFNGSRCLASPRRGNGTFTQRTVDVGVAVQGPIPLTGGSLHFGDQWIHYSCKDDPNCEQAPEVIDWSTMVTARDFDRYVHDQHREHGYLGEPQLARLGVYLHWVADRASHWYMTDSPHSGIVARQRNDDNNKTKGYELYLYLDSFTGSFVNHGYQHMMEQAMMKANNYHLAPGSYAAMRAFYRELKDFKDRFRSTKPEWFDDAKVEQPFEVMVGTYEKPGAVFRMAGPRKAEERVAAMVHILAELDLPPMRGFEHADCTRDRGEEDDLGGPATSAIARRSLRSQTHG